MKPFTLLVIFSVAAIVFAAIAHAAVDGSRPLLCASQFGTECGPNGSCRGGPVDEFDIPEFFRVDFVAKLVSGVRADGETRQSAIHRVERSDGQLILQGVEDGRGWSATISEETGKLVITASGDRVAFVVFGACLPQ